LQLCETEHTYFHVCRLTINFLVLVSSSAEHLLLPKTFELQFLSKLSHYARRRKGLVPTFKLEKFLIPQKLFDMMMRETKGGNIRFAFTDCHCLESSLKIVRIADTSGDWADNLEGPQGSSPATPPPAGLPIELDPFIYSTPDADKAKPAARHFCTFDSPVPAHGPKASGDAPPVSNNNSMQQQPPVADGVDNSIWSKFPSEKEAKRCSSCSMLNELNATVCVCCEAELKSVSKDGHEISAGKENYSTPNYEESLMVKLAAAKMGGTIGPNGFTYPVMTKSEKLPTVYDSTDKAVPQAVNNGGANATDVNDFASKDGCNTNTGKEECPALTTSILNEPSDVNEVVEGSLLSETNDSDNGPQRVSRRKLGLAPEHGLLN
jgi:hypothetical protein